MPGVQHWQVPLAFGEALNVKYIEGEAETVVGKCILRANATQPGNAIYVKVWGTFPVPETPPVADPASRVTRERREERSEITPAPKAPATKSAGPKKIKLLWNDVKVLDTGDITTGSFIMEADIFVGQNEMAVLGRTTVGSTLLTLASSIVKDCNFRSDIICRIVGEGFAADDIVVGYVSGLALAQSSG